jgi:hypothetical protein
MVLYSVILYSTKLVGCLGSDGFWDRDYGWGDRVSRPFGTLEELCKGLGSVALK